MCVCVCGQDGQDDQHGQDGQHDQNGENGEDGEEDKDLHLYLMMIRNDLMFHLLSGDCGEMSGDIPCIY